jgi:hypothetical protein
MMTEHNPHTKVPMVRDQAAKREMVEKHGDPSQVERYYAGLLPDDELLALARRILFAPLSGFRRYQNVASARGDQVVAKYLRPADVKHAEGCPATDSAIRFFTRAPGDGITGNEWRDFKSVVDAIGPSAQVELVEHVGVCTYCRHREAISRSASVRIAWAGNELLREYALGGS